MRIIAGERRGLKLEAVKGLMTRPTADRVKEGLYNMLQFELEKEAIVLDCFAGTGSLGLEALSRGAREVVFIEKKGEARDVLKRNIAKCRYEEKCQILFGDALQLLPTLQGRAFDLILVDPPYHENLYQRAFFLIKKYHLLSKYGIIVSEHAKSVPFTMDDSDVFLYKSKTYGDTILNFFKPSEAYWRDC